MLWLQQMTARPASWWRKAFAGVGLIVLAAAIVIGLVSKFGIAQDFGFLRASLMSGAPGGRYHTLASHLAARAESEHGNIAVVTTAGSLDNVSRLLERHSTCSEAFGFIQDGTPIAANSGLEVLGRLPEPESLFLLGRRGRRLAAFEDLKGASIGIGPDASGTAHLMRRLFADKDLQTLETRLSTHDLREQAAMVGDGQLDLAAFVMNDDADFLRNIIRQYDLELVSPRDIEGLVARHAGLSLGRIPAGRFDLVRPTPEVDKTVARVDTLVLANSCARRAERIAFLMLLSAELTDFVRSNPPRVISAATAAPLAREARQFFLTGEPEFADRYFPWLVDLMSPAYWIYLAMAVTVLFNAMNGYSKFRLWRLDSAREKLEEQLEHLTGRGLTREQIRALPSGSILNSPGARSTAQALLDQVLVLRARCQRQTSSMFTPMGEEMFYRYQESLINETATTLGILLGHEPGQATARQA